MKRGVPPPDFLETRRINEMMKHATHKARRRLWKLWYSTLSENRSLEAWEEMARATSKRCQMCERRSDCEECLNDLG